MKKDWEKQAYRSLDIIEWLNFPSQISGFVLPASRTIMSWCLWAVKPSSRTASAEEHLLTPRICPLPGEACVQRLVYVGVKVLWVSPQHKISLKSPPPPLLGASHKLVWGLTETKPQSAPSTWTPASFAFEGGISRTLPVKTCDTGLCFRLGSYQKQIATFFNPLLGFLLEIITCGQIISNLYTSVWGNWETGETFLK